MINLKMNNQEKNKLKRKTISLQTKIAILNRLAKGEGSTALGKEFGLGESTVRSIQKRSNEIYKSGKCATKESATRASYSRNTLIEKSEKALVIWIQDLTQKRIPINGEMIKAKAKWFYNQMKHSESSSSTCHVGKATFAGSNGWLTRFLERHALHNLKIMTEATSADETVAKNFSKELARIIDNGEYSPNQVFNAVETGLFWKKMPNRMFIAKSEINASAAEDRVTFLLCCNASGARMLKPLIINKSLRPRILKDKNIAKLPVHIMTNKKARITSTIFTTWFNDYFVPEVEKYMTDIGLPFKVLLIVDNAHVHPCLAHPNVNVMFLPPNNTSFSQPLDQGIITAFKKHYVKFTFRYILDKLKNDSVTLTEVWNNFSILDCITHAVAAISEIKQHALNACWKVVWPECVLNSNATQNNSDLTSEIIALAYEIGGDGFNTFNEIDIHEMIQDKLVSESDITSNATDPNDNQEESNSMTANSIFAGLQLCNKLETHFLAIDTNFERAKKFQNELRSCMSAYCDIYKRLTNKPSSPNLITDYTVPQRMFAPNGCEVASSDETDCNPLLHMKIYLSDYDED